MHLNVNPVFNVIELLSLLFFGSASVHNTAFTFKNRTLENPKIAYYSMGQHKNKNKLLSEVIMHSVSGMRSSRLPKVNV